MSASKATFNVKKKRKLSIFSDERFMYKLYTLATKIRVRATRVHTLKQRMLGMQRADPPLTSGLRAKGLIDTSTSTSATIKMQSTH